jgi:membrane fusion protein (multidrug efflux system)
MDAEQTQNVNSPAPGAREEQNNRPPLWQRRPIIVAGILGMAVLLFFGLQYFVESLTHESTDDAFLDATVVSIAPRVAGQARKVHVDHNQSVKAGDPLVELDPQDYDVQVAQKRTAQVAAEANVKLLIATLEMLGTQVATAEATAKESEATAASDQAAAEKAGADLKRAEELMRNKTISPQEYDAARAAATGAEAKWRASREKAASNLSKIAESRAQLEAGRRAWERSRAQAAQSAVDVQQADLNLSYTRIVAPQDGHVTKKAVEAGDYVQVGQRLLALVAEDLYVIANFKETQLRSIRTNQPVKIRIDSVAGRAFSGRVQSIQAGSGAAFSLLPPENAVGNYVKVVQRVPVKIVFDKPFDPGQVLGPGMSVEPSVRVASFEVPEAVVLIAAVILSLVAGFLWWRMADREGRQVQPS